MSNNLIKCFANQRSAIFFHCLEARKSIIEYQNALFIGSIVGWLELHNAPKLVAGKA